MPQRGAPESRLISSCPGLAAIDIHHSGVAPCRQHVYTRRRTRCTSHLRLEDDACETMPTKAAARPVSGLTHAEQQKQQCGHKRGAAAHQPPHQHAGRRRRGLRVPSSTKRGGWVPRSQHSNLIRVARAYDFEAQLTRPACSGFRFQLHSERNQLFSLMLASQVLQ